MLMHPKIVFAVCFRKYSKIDKDNCGVNCSNDKLFPILDTSLYRKKCNN